MKKVVLVTLSLVSFCLLARPKNNEAFLKNTGGHVIRPTSQKGEICYINCQTNASLALIKASVDYFAEETRFKITLKNGSFNIHNPVVEGEASLYIVYDESLPVILVAPENRWAVVNIAPIAKEKRQAFFEARVKKELSRGFAFLCGASNSQFPRSLTRGIVRQSDLDRNPDQALPVDVLQRFRTYMSDLGVTPAIRATYRKACQEGWAPQPTNDIQKAIWNQVHQIPDKPITIEFDPKKDK